MRKHLVEKIDYKKHNINIYIDENAESPRNNDNLCIFHVAHRKYSFGDKNYNSYESIKEAEKEAKENNDIILPLYMYDHSGITISLSPFSCRWDSGTVGFVQIPRKNILKEFSISKITKKIREKALSIAKSEVEVLDAFLRGEVYGFVIDENGDSCWGFIGDRKYCIDEAKSIIDYMVEDEEKEKIEKIKKHCRKLKHCILNKVSIQKRESLIIPV